MRKTLFALTALAGLIGAGAATSASAAPWQAPRAEPFAQTVQFYEGGYGPRADWRAYEWRRHEEWERHRRWAEWHRWHDGHHGW